MSWAGGAGAIYSTVGDLFHWTEALHGGRVVNADSLKAMTTPNPLPRGCRRIELRLRTGGFRDRAAPDNLAQWRSERLVEQPDVAAPNNSVTLVAPRHRAASGAGIQPRRHHARNAEAFPRGGNCQAAPHRSRTRASTPGPMPRMSGATITRERSIRSRWRKTGCFPALSGQQRFEIFPQGTDEFFWKIADARVHFLRNDKGEVVAAQHTQGGNTFRAARLADDTMRLSPEQLDAFVGQYQYGLLAVMTVKRDDQQLFAQLTGQPEFPIFPTGGGQFRMARGESQRPLCEGRRRQGDQGCAHAKRSHLRRAEGEVGSSLEERRGASVEIAFRAGFWQRKACSRTERQSRTSPRLIGSP